MYSLSLTLNFLLTDIAWFQNNFYIITCLLCDIHWPHALKGQVVASKHGEASIEVKLCPHFTDVAFFLTGP